MPILPDDHNLCIHICSKEIEELRPNTDRGCTLEEEVDSFVESTGFTKQLAIYHEPHNQDGRPPVWGYGL